MKTEKNYPCTVEDYGFEKIEKVLSLIGGKWKMQIIYHLGCNDRLRYGQLKREIPAVTHKILIQQLKNLEKDGFVLRKENAELPLRVEYQLTKLGLSLLPVYEAFGDWCQKNQLLFEDQLIEK
ncbi:winged helix-turn-helix transcriptional regulator [Enterococcus sp. LJL99]